MTKVYNSSLSGKKRKSLSADGSKFEEMLTNCLPKNMNIEIKGRKRSKCQIGWKDVDGFNLETKNKRDLEEIKIDSKKFVTAVKNAGSRTKEFQLLTLSKYVINNNANNIVGSDRYLMLQIIKNNGYKNYINNEIILRVADSPNTKMPPQLKQKLIGKAKAVQLLGTAYLTAKICKENQGIKCLNQIISFSAVIAEPLLAKIVKSHKWASSVDDMATILGKIAPKVLAYNTKFAISMLKIGEGRGVYLKH